MRALRLLGTVLLLGTAAAQGVTLRGDVGLDSGVAATSAGGQSTIRVPVVVRARVEVDADISNNAGFRAVLLPALGGGTAGGDPLASLGLQEAFFRYRYRATDLSAGFERLPLIGMRLIEPLSIEPRLETGEPRGPLALRLLHYNGPWRARAAVVAVTGADLLPDGPGALVSLRYESPALTAEGHALWTVRPAVGATLSGSVGSFVAYGEGWLLADPWEGRGGVGVTGYLGEWLWTLEAAWAAPSGDLRLRAQPVVAASASRPFGFSATLDATVAASWPRSPVDPQRITRLDAAISLRQDTESASLTVTPAFHLAGDLIVGSLGVSLRTYY